MEQIRETEKYADIADKVIKSHDDLLWIYKSGVTIGYLTSDKEKKSKGRAVLAECHLVKPLYKPFVPYDFLIVVYEANVSGMSDEQLEVLMYHELLHVGMKDSEAEPEYKVIPHDVEDFRKVIDAFGIDWSIIGR